MHANGRVKRIPFTHSAAYLRSSYVAIVIRAAILIDGKHKKTIRPIQGSPERGEGQQNGQKQDHFACLYFFMRCEKPAISPAVKRADARDICRRGEESQHTNSVGILR